MTIAAQTSEGVVRFTLHTIVARLLDVIDAAGGEVTAAVDELELQLECKVEAYAAVTRQLAAEAEAFSGLAYEYKLKAAARENQITALKFRLEQAMAAVGVEKIKAPTATAYMQASTSVALENEGWFLASAEDRFVKVTQAVNKAELKKALEAGEAVSGAELRTNRHLRFR